MIHLVILVQVAALLLQFGVWLMMLCVMSLEDRRSLARATPLKLCWIGLLAVELNDIRLHFLRAAFSVDFPWPPTAAARSALSFAIAASGLFQRPPAPASAEAYGRLEESDGPTATEQSARAPAGAPPGGAEATASLFSQVPPPRKLERG